MAHASRAPSWPAQAVALWQKELRLERRERTRVRTLIPFALLVLLMFSLAVGPEVRLLRRLAGGTLWLAVLFASVQSLAESMRLERADHALEGLRMLGTSASALFVAKALSNALFVFIVALVLVPAAIALFDVPIAGNGWALGLALGLGALALSAPGTLFAALASDARAKGTLLPLLLFPLLMPVLLGAVKATDLVLLGDPMDELSVWLGLLAAFNLLFWPLCALLFHRVVEEA